MHRAHDFPALNYTRLRTESQRRPARSVSGVTSCTIQLPPDCRKRPFPIVSIQAKAETLTVRQRRKETREYLFRLMTPRYPIISARFAALCLVSLVALPSAQAQAPVGPETPTTPQSSETPQQPGQSGSQATPPPVNPTLKPPDPKAQPKLQLKTPPPGTTPPPRDNGLPKPTPGVSPKMPPSTASRRPDLFEPLPFYTKRDNFFFDGAVDLRYRTVSISGEEGAEGTYIPAVRLTGDYIRANPKTGDERGGVRLQLVLENDNRESQIKVARLSEAYAFYRFLFPGVSANVRAGQFVLPFGLIAIYDTPLQPIQPLYEKSLGLRVDRGFMLEGDWGVYHYAGSITTGAGPNRPDTDNTWVYTFRLERTFPTRLGRFQVGGSALSGRGPVTTFATELPPSGQSRALRYVDRTRFAVDGVYLRGSLLARGELVFGADDQDPVWGYFAEGNYRTTSRLTVVGFTRRWNFPQKPERIQTLAAGANYDLGKGFILRSLFEYERQVPSEPTLTPITIRRFTVQTVLNF
jgi:hypothetical protein